MIREQHGIPHHPSCTPDYPEKPAKERPGALVRQDLGDGEWADVCSDCGSVINCAFFLIDSPEYVRKYGEVEKS